MNINSYRKHCAIWVLILNTVNAGCGINSNTNIKDQQRSTRYSQTNQRNDFPSQNEENPTSNPSPSPTPTGSPPLSLTVRKIGYDSPYTVPVQARRVLRIKFTPGLPNETVQGTGFTPQYSQLGVFISVGTQELPTPLLHNGLLGEQESSPIMDFSNAIPNTCPANEPTCRVTVTVTLRKPNYDYWCFNYGAYCSHTRVWETHPWNGELKIETDDTIPLN
jgi:hypothetical protein